MAIAKEAKADESLNISAVNGASKSYDELIKYVTPIAKPLATKKLTKRIYKCVKKAKAHRNKLFYGVKPVQRMLRREPAGMVVLAGDTEPIELICHLPIVCEDKDIPYCYVPSHKELGAVASKQSVICVMIKKDSSFEDAYDECVSGIKKLPPVH